MGGDSGMTTLLGAVVGAVLAIPTGGASLGITAAAMAGGAALGAVGGYAASEMMGGMMGDMGQIPTQTAANDNTALEEQYKALLASQETSEQEAALMELQAQNMELSNAMLHEQLAATEELKAETAAEKAAAEAKQKRRLLAMQNGGGSLIKTSGSGASGTAKVKKKTLGGA